MSKPPLRTGNNRDPISEAAPRTNPKQGAMPVLWFRPCVVQPHMSEYAMTPKDRRLERSIQIASLEAYASQSPEERRTAWERLKRLIAQRSPERVREIAARKEQDETS